MNTIRMANISQLPLEDNYFKTLSRPEDFSFNEKVADVFDDMVSRSVPFYDEVQRMQSNLVLEFLPRSPEPARICDLGCSTGTTISLILGNPKCPDNTLFTGYDNSWPMIKKAKEKLGRDAENGRVSFIGTEFSEITRFPTASVFLMNWTLQFVRPIDRLPLVEKIYRALKPGGALFLSEKILSSSSHLNRMYIQHYLDYKKISGRYSDEENQRKREALENVLIPYRNEENLTLLKQAGFKLVDTCFRWLNFTCLVAIKEHNSGQW